MRVKGQPENMTEKVNKKEVAYVGQTGSLILSTLYLHEKHNSLVL
jgi:hypothetical protein